MHIARTTWITTPECTGLVRTVVVLEGTGTVERRDASNECLWPSASPSKSQCRLRCRQRGPAPPDLAEDETASVPRTVVPGQRPAPTGVLGAMKEAISVRAPVSAAPAVDYPQTELPVHSGPQINTRPSSWHNQQTRPPSKLNAPNARRAKQKPRVTKVVRARSAHRKDYQAEWELLSARGVQ